MNRTIAPLLAASAFALAAAAACDAHETSEPDLTVENVWVRAPLGESDVAATYLVINNHGPADRLVAASSPAAAAVEIHTHLMDDGVMRMRKVDAVDLPAHAKTAFESGGHHLMLFGLDPAADPVPLTLQFEVFGAVTVEAPVGEGPAAAAHNH